MVVAVEGQRLCGHTQVNDNDTILGLQPDISRVGHHHARTWVLSLSQNAQMTLSVPNSRFVVTKSTMLCTIAPQHDTHV